MAKKKKTTKKIVKKAPKKKAASKKEYKHHPDHYNTSEAFLTENLPEDLKDAWEKIRAYGASLGEQRIYASGRAIMFSKKVCYFFVRPKKSYLETVIFLPRRLHAEGFKIEPVTKTKFSHTFKLVHPDQVEGVLTDAIFEAYGETPA